MIISLTGYMGCGKSTLGKKLSEYFNYAYIDLDQYITSQEKSTINEIFSEKGEIYFRKIENLYLKEILEQDNLILSLGGGTPAYFNNMELINNRSISFYLKMTPAELATRLVHEKMHRPVIAHLKNEELKEFIAKHLFERSYYYEKAKYKINSNQKSVADICNELITIIKFL